MNTNEQIRYWAQLILEESEYSIDEHIHSKNPWADKDSQLSRTHATLADRSPTDSIARQASHNILGIVRGFLNGGDDYVRNFVGDVILDELSLDGLKYPFGDKFEKPYDAYQFVWSCFDDMHESDEYGYNETAEDMKEQFTKQTLNKVVVKPSSGGMNGMLKSGTYSAKTNTEKGRLAVKITVRKPVPVAYADMPETPRHKESPEEFKKRRGELVKPNLPKESVDGTENDFPADREADSAFKTSCKESAQQIVEGINGLLGLYSTPTFSSQAEELQQAVETLIQVKDIADSLVELSR